MASVSVGIMGAVLSGGDPRTAWRAFRELVENDPAHREAVRRLAETEDGRALLDDSRSAWRARGFEAPFDFIFEDPGRAQELR